MSEGSVFVREDGRACAKYTDAKGKTRYLYGKSKPEVRRKLRQALKDKDEGITPGDGEVTVGAFLDLWLEDMRDVVSKRTRLNHEGIVRLHLKPNIGAKKLARLSSKDIHGLYKSKRTSLSAGRVRHIHVTLNRALKEAVSWQYISRNPASNVKPPKELAQQEKDVLTPEHVEQLLAACRGDRLEGVYVLGATCGLRLGEVLALRFEDINLEAATLKIKRTVWRNQVNPPKTKNSRRTIRLPRIALDALRRHRNKSNGAGEGWLFSTSGGNPIDAANFTHRNWKRMLRKAGLPESTTYHYLRHGAASLLLSQKVPIPVVSKYLGHANPSITLRVYAHMIDGDDGLAGSAMDDLLG
jgi:integrase